MVRDADQDDHLDEPRRRLRGLLWLTVGVVVVAGAGAGYWFVVRDGGTEPASVSTGPVATAEVTLGSIAATETWEGTLGHGSPFTVSATGQGVLTRLVAQAAAVERGTELYRLNEQPVTALLGVIPMYRDLGPDDTGIDVEQLEANLVALGYDGFTPDDEYTWYTGEAVREWQEDIGAAETGTVAQTDVVFLPEGGRVDTVHADVGGTVQPGAAVLDITGTDQVVSLEVEVDDRDLVAVDTAVAVALPDGTEVAGTVTSATVVEAESSDTGGAAAGGGAAEGGAAAENTITEVEVALAAPVDEAFVGAPVDVVVPVDERADVLLVPVNALLALAEGGYGLEVVAPDGSTSIIAVETGLFADGQVEITTGDGITEGTTVGVAGR